MLYGEYDSSGNFVREYVYLNGAPLAQVDAGSPEVLTYLHTDHLGTPRFGTDSSGTQVWSWSSDGFGVGATSGSRTVNLRMPGQYYDAESALFYNWNRYYNPAIGRYISSDPIGIAGGLNTFGYAGQNPVMYTDPTGQIIPLLILGGEILIEGGALAVEAGTLYCRRYPLACARALVTASEWFGQQIDGMVNPNQNVAIQKGEMCPTDENVNSDQKQAERSRYHSVCDTPPPSSGDPCLDAKAKVQWHQQCIDLRQAFANKWYNGSYDKGHAQQITEKTVALNKAKEDVVKYCK